MHASPHLVQAWPIHLEGKERAAGAGRLVQTPVPVIHAQRADRQGNVQLWGITGVQKEALLAAKRSLVTVEEVVDELDPRPGAVVLPSWVVTAVAVVPGGARPSYAHGYYDRDNGYYQRWDPISRDRERFTAWLAEHIYATGPAVTPDGPATPNGGDRP